VFLGEVGLAGEVRPQASSAPHQEISRLGFRRVLVPAGNCPVSGAPADLDIVGLKSVEQLLDVIF
jgi:DNA repair protein RadA/Sms